MKVKKIRFKNIGPIESLEVDLSTNEENSCPVVLVGLNGSGKSTILSYIADAFIEFKRYFYEDIEAEPQKYFKLSSLSYVTRGKNYGFCEIIFTEKDKEYFYSEVLSLLKWEKFKEEYEKGKISIKGFNLLNSKFKEGRMQKSYSREKELKEVIDSNVFLYFPWNRTEIPAWINKEGVKISFRRMERFINRSYRNIVNLGNFEELYSWILDVILDEHLYHQQISYDSSLSKNLNLIIDAVLSNKKHHQNERIRFNIGRREMGSRISIVKDQLNEKGEIADTKQLSPTIFHLSSGESSLLNIFASILMDYDRQRRVREDLSFSFSLEDITGIVLIDEADLHLHVNLQVEVFPKLLKLFPGIQFIITTQSPFLVYGLQERLQNELKIIELPKGDLINAERFTEFKNALEKFNEIGESFRKQKEALEEKIKSMTKPLIITEGKTDWMILEKAKGKLNIDLDIDFYKPQKDLGKDNLIKMCEYFSKINQSKPLIFIFDRDLNERDTKKVMDDSKGYKCWENNVFSFVLPVPSHRKEYTNISIEMFFRDEEIKTQDQEDRRLFFTNEVEKIVNSTTGKFEKYKIISPNTNDEFSKKILSNDVDKVEDESGRKKALTKTKFAEYIYKDVSPFNSFDFTEFKKIFQIIEKILKENNHARNIYRKNRRFDFKSIGECKSSKERKEGRSLFFGFFPIPCYNC